MSWFSLVLSNLGRKKLRTALTMLSIFVAFLLFGFLCAIKEAFNAGVTLAGADRLIARNKVSLIMSLPVSYQQRMANIPGVELATHTTWFNGIYQEDAKNFFGSFPVVPEEFFEIYPEYILPKEQMEAWNKTKNGAVIGKILADRMKWKIGDRIPLKSPIWLRKGGGAWDFEIVGIYEGTKKGSDTSGFYFRYDYFDEGREDDMKGLVGWYGVRVNDPDKAGEIAAKIDAEFANSPYETKAEPEGAFMQSFVQQLGDIGSILIAILSAVFFTILLVAGNTMGQAVRERVEEIGVLKSLGFANESILGMVMAESCVIACTGGLTGLGLAWLLTLGGSPAPEMLPIFYLPHENILIGIALVLLLGIAAGIFPALQAMRLQIATALRRQA